MDASIDPRPTMKLTTNEFLFASDARLERFLLGRAESGELEAAEAIGVVELELSTDAMLAQIAEYRANREKRKVLGTIRIMLAAVGYH